MTRTLVLTLTPQQPAVFSARAATQGAHGTLDAPSGANLLGWAASCCYAEIEAALHSGRLRFSNAVRMVGEAGAFPNPAILLVPKHGDAPVRLGHAAFVAAYPDQQAEAVKGGQFTLDGQQAPAPRRARRLRTAMKDGVADEGRLFGYQSVEPGATLLRATIELDGDDDRALDSLVAAFDGQTLHLGRGAGSGYGGAYLCQLGGASPWPPTGQAFTGHRVRFWLLSDVSFRDAWGMPRLDPVPADFGLRAEGWALEPSESSATTRRIWPWNGTYGSRDMEMAVIEAGSVFTFARAGGAVEERLPTRLGAAQDRGLGRYALIANDTAFTLAQVQCHDPLPEVASLSADAASQSPLIALARKRARLMNVSGDSAWVDEQAEEVAKLVQQLGSEGPGASQWANLERLAAHFRDGDGTFEGDLDDLLRGEDWQAGFGILADWVRHRLFQHDGANVFDVQSIIGRARKAAQGVRS